MSEIEWTALDDITVAEIADLLSLSQSGILKNITVGNLFASPPAIGGATEAAGTFTVLTTGSEKGISLTTQGSPFSLHTASAVFNSTRADLCYWGYNLAVGTTSTKVDSGEHQLKIEMAADFDTGSSNLGELNFNYLSADGGTSKRFFAFTVDLDTHDGIWQFDNNKQFRIETANQVGNFTFEPVGIKKCTFRNAGISEEWVQIGSDGGASAPDEIQIGPNVTNVSGPTDLSIHKAGGVEVTKLSIGTDAAPTGAHLSISGSGVGFTEIFINASQTSGRTSYQTDAEAVLGVTAATGGSYPFNLAGHLYLQSRGSANRDIIFATGSTPANRMSIDGFGNVAVGDAAIGTAATSGFLYIPTCAGTPTGVPTTKTGRAPMVYDSTGNKFWMYDGGWIGIALS